MSNGGSQGETQMRFQPRQQDQREPRWPLARGEGLTQLVRTQQPPNQLGREGADPQGDHTAGGLVLPKSTRSLPRPSRHLSIARPWAGRSGRGPSEDPGPALLQQEKALHRHKRWHKHRNDS